MRGDVIDEKWCICIVVYCFIYVFEDDIFVLYVLRVLFVCGFIGFWGIVFGFSLFIFVILFVECCIVRVGRIGRIGWVGWVIVRVVVIGLDSWIWECEGFDFVVDVYSSIWVVVFVGVREFDYGFGVVIVIVLDFDLYVREIVFRLVNVWLMDIYLIICKLNCLDYRISIFRGE